MHKQKTTAAAASSLQPPSGGIGAGDGHNLSSSSSSSTLAGHSRGNYTASGSAATPLTGRAGDTGAGSTDVVSASTASTDDRTATSRQSDLDLSLHRSSPLTPQMVAAEPLDVPTHIASKLKPGMPFPRGQG